MNKPELTPFDWDMIAMVKNLTKGYKEPEVAEDIKNNRFEIYWNLPTDSENYDKIHTAIVAAIKGKMGERYIDTISAETNVTYIAFDPESYPEEIRFELSEPDQSFGEEFLRQIVALKFINDGSVDLIVDFVGGGTLTVPKTDKPATFKFIDQDGLNQVANEGDYVVFENEKFSVIDGKEFEKFYTRNR